MSEAAIGTYLGIRAILHIGMTPLYSYLADLVDSTMRLHRILMWTWPLSVLCIPLLNLLARIYGTESWILSTMLMVYFIIWSLSGFTWRMFFFRLPVMVLNYAKLVTVAIMITDASPSLEALSTINVSFDVKICTYDLILYPITGFESINHRFASGCRPCVCDHTFCILH
jgi:hypothetical protein